MNRGYVREQREMNPTKIKREVGYLVPHEKIIEVRYDQNMVFQEGSDVPFWMTTQEHIATNFNQYAEP